MMKFASFETVVEMIYARLPGHKDDYGKGAQAGVAFAGGYIAGILCAIVCPPVPPLLGFISLRPSNDGIGISPCGCDGLEAQCEPSAWRGLRRGYGTHL